MLIAKEHKTFASVISADALELYISDLEKKLAVGVKMARENPDVISAAEIQKRSAEMRPEAAKVIVANSWICDLAPIFARLVEASSRREISYD